jgi:lysozyme family protein
VQQAARPPGLITQDGLIRACQWLQEAVMQCPRYQNVVSDGSIGAR